MAIRSLILSILSICLFMQKAKSFSPGSRELRKACAGHQSSQDDTEGTSPLIKPMESEAVDFVLSRISKLLEGNGQTEGPEISEKEITGLFDKIFSDIKDESDLSPQTREMMTMELNVAYASVKGTSTHSLPYLILSIS